jgi:hypothetical protein
MKTIKRSELDGVTGWLSKDGVVRICSMKTRWRLDGECEGTGYTDDDIYKRCGDTPLTGDSLISALHERGVEVIDDTRPALGGPDDEAARKWAEENGYEVVGWRLPKKGEQYIEYLGTPNQCVLASPKDFNHVRCYILTPKAKPVEAKPDKWAHLPEGGEWFTQTCLNPDTLWHFPTTGNTGTWYHANGLVGNTSAVGNCIYPRLPLGPYLKAISREQAIAIFEANAKPEAKPAETPAFTEADQLRKELDEAKATINRLHDSLTKAETDRQQPPMSDERFLQEAAIHAPQCPGWYGVQNDDGFGEAGRIARWRCHYANALLAAMKGGAQ